MMKTTVGRLLAYLVSAQARPWETWLLRAVLAYFGVRLGVDAADAAH